MTTHSNLYVGDNTHVVELVGLADQDGTVQTDATVQLTALVDRHGTTVTGITLPLTMSHVSAGLYRASIAHGLGISEGKVYRATIQATSSSGLRGEWYETLIAKRRAA